MIGSTIGHYQILGKLGAGGMGEVYRAEDTTLDREVALKVLPAELAESQERLDRFEREAKTLAALDHPNIVTIYSVESADVGEGLAPSQEETSPTPTATVRFLTMQLVEGKRLSDLIPKGGMPLERIFDIAIPLADALAVAHEKGVIHRDLKPANIMLSDEGRVKVLDFGLAKLLAPASTDVGAPLVGAQEGASPSPTQVSTDLLTAEGRILGTVPYMSPEQLEGKELDSRSDIFSLGVILYEMATGERPFQGDSSASVIAAIMTGRPQEVDVLRPDLPHHLGRIIRHCLEKNPEHRYQSAKDVRNELQDLHREEASSAAIPATSMPELEATTRRVRWPLAAGVAIMLIALVALWLGRSRTLTEAPEDSLTGAGAPAEAPPPMIVVLPFENLGDPEDEYFADGMTEEITSRLAVVSGLRVISRTSAMQYKENRPSLKQVGEELGVDYVLEGSVRWAPADGSSRVRITPQLIRVADDSHLWADSYDRVIKDVFEIQSDIASQVVSQLGVTLGGSEREEVEARPTENLEAYQVYLRGMANIRQSGGMADQNWTTAEKMFVRVTALDPEFALAHARLSQARSTLLYAAGEVEASRWEPARQAAETALELQPDLPEAHAALGEIHYRAERDYDRALEHLTIAAGGRPSDPYIQVSIAAIHRRRGELEKAVAEFEKAAMLDPRSSGVAWELGNTLTRLRRYREADGEYARSISLGPDQGGAYLSRAENRIQWTGDLLASRAILEEAPGRFFFSDVLWYAQLWLERDYEGLLHRISEWGELDCLHCSQYWHIPRLYEAAAYRALGDADRARAACEKARAELESAAAEHPEVPGIRATLGEAYAGLGLKDEALREGRLAVEIRPISEDAMQGTALQWHLANIYVIVGEYNDALDLLDELLSIPCGISVQWLKLDPIWDPLRDHPSFQALLEKYR